MPNNSSKPSWGSSHLVQPPVTRFEQRQTRKREYNLGKGQNRRNRANARRNRQKHSVKGRNSNWSVSINEPQGTICGELPNSRRSINTRTNRRKRLDNSNPTPPKQSNRSRRMGRLDTLNLPHPGTGVHPRKRRPSKTRNV